MYIHMYSTCRQLHAPNLTCFYENIVTDFACKQGLLTPVPCLILLGHRSQRLQWPIVITRCPASVRPSVVRRPLDYLHFRLLLQNRLMDFDETWYGWSTQGPLQVLLFFGQIRPGADPGRRQNRSWGVPFFRKLLLQNGRLQQQTECIAVI